MGFHRDKSGVLIHSAQDGSVTKVPSGDEHEYVGALHASERQEPVPPPGIVAVLAPAKRKRKPRASKK